MLLHGLLLALAFYAGIVVGMTHVATGGGSATHHAVEHCAPCPDSAAGQPQNNGPSDAQIESIVEKRVEVGKSILDYAFIYSLVFTRMHVGYNLCGMCIWFVIAQC